MRVMLHPDAAPRHTWTPARQITPLHDDEVQVWRVLVDLNGHARAAAAIAEAVTEDEHDRAARFRHEADRQRFLHGRLLLRTFVGHHLGIPPRVVPFINAAFGKPEVQLSAAHAESAIDHRGTLRFNIAHSGEWVLFAVARDREVGVDVEHHRTMSDVMDLARRFFAPPEVAALEAIDSAMHHDAFFRVWTRKEAIVKAIGRGLSAGLERFAVSAERTDTSGGGEEVALRGLDDDPVWERWTIHALEMPPDYAAAVAFDRHASAHAGTAISSGRDVGVARGDAVTVSRFEWTPW